MKLDVSETMGTGSFPGVRRPGRGADHPPPPFKRRGHERVGLHLYSPSGPQWPVIGRTLPLPLRRFESRLSFRLRARRAHNLVGPLDR